MKHLSIVKRGMISLILMFILSAGNAFAYDVSAICPSGQRLYYNINTTDFTAEVTYPGTAPNFWSPSSHTLPTDSLIIPATITHQGNTYTVNTIGNNAFTNCARITVVILSNSVTSINDSAFQFCSSIKHVNLPNTITNIGASAFEYCTGLKRIQLPSRLTSLGSGAFSLCRQLDSITLPQTITVIPSSLFYSCNSLSLITIPNTVTRIEEYAFHMCNSLRSINLPNSINYIGNNAFASCRNLRIIVLPNTLAAINAYTFHSCDRLERVRIPETVTTIRGNAFAGDTSLMDIVILNPEPPSLGANAFSGVDRSIMVHIPCGSLESYSPANGWRDFTNLTEYPGFYFSYDTDDTLAGRVEVLVHPTCTDSTAVVQAIPFAGYQFAYWNDGDTANPHTVNVTVDSIVIAYFRYVGGIGIDPTAVDASVITAENRTILISNAEGMAVRVYDIAGRLCHYVRQASRQQRITVDYPGVYLVQTDSYPAHKIYVP